ncbi:GNAT family N-acetyltransferase [Tsuneonella flava]|uniref:GNAT family N-acetyltransferase n=1 Tax=Tsuneonella flava TaxID=2055955 RepID=UPI001CC20884|nr:GNAT family N-acetyltransferase [Tsuneonella flava]
MTDTEPLLVTERLELWRPRAEDEPQMFAIISDPRTHRYLGPMSSRADHFLRFQRGGGSWFLHGYGSFMVRLRGKAEVIGNCGVFHSWRGLGDDFDDMPECGWILSAEYVGQGIAGEAMRAALTWFDEVHGPRDVVCMIEPGNDPSMMLAGKLGFAKTRLAELPDGVQVQLFRRDAVG